MTVIKTSALAKPLGFLPESEYGETYEGSEVMAGASQGDTSIDVSVSDPDWTEDIIVGLIIKINDFYYAVTSFAAIPGGYRLGINPGLQEALPEPGDDVNLVLIPFQHAISSIDPTEEFNRDTLGVVGTGHTESASTQAGREFNLSLSGKKGRDLMWNSMRPNVHSTLLGLALSQDGKLNETLEVVSRDGTESTASVTIFWLTETGEVRRAPGCVISSYSEKYEDGIDDIASVDANFMGQYIDDDPTSLSSRKLVSPLKPYTNPLVVSHGLVSTQFYHKSALYQPFTPPEPGGLSVFYCEVLGFEEGDSIYIKSDLGNLEGPFTIKAVDAVNKFITVEDVVVNDYDEMTSWVESASPKKYPLSSMTFNLTTGLSLVGEVSDSKDYKTMVVPSKMSIEAEIMFRRADYLWYRINRLNSSMVRIITEKFDYLHASKVGVSPICTTRQEWAITSPSNDKLDDGRTEISDALTLKNIGFPEITYLQGS